MSGKPEKKWQYYKKHHSETLIFKPDHHQNTDNLAGVSKHTDDPWGKKIFHSIYITNKAWSQSSRFQPCQFVRSKAYEFFHKAASKCMCDFLPKYGKQTFPGRFHESGKCKHCKIKENHPECHGFSRCDCIYDFCQDQRRDKSRYHCACYSKDNTHRQPFLLQNCFPDHTFYLSFFRFCNFPFSLVFYRKNICIWPSALFQNHIFFWFHVVLISVCLHSLHLLPQ